jgi:hypothetical protein
MWTRLAQPKICTAADQLPDRDRVPIALAHLREGNGVQVDTQGDAGIGFIEDMQALWNCGHRSLFVS